MLKKEILLFRQKTHTEDLNKNPIFCEKFGDQIKFCAIQELR
jgi:hypothetical protein